MGILSKPLKYLLFEKLFNARSQAQSYVYMYHKMHNFLGRGSRTVCFNPFLAVLDITCFKLKYEYLTSCRCLTLLFGISF